MVTLVAPHLSMTEEQLRVYVKQMIEHRLESKGVLTSTMSAAQRDTIINSVYSNAAGIADQMVQNYLEGQAALAGYPTYTTNNS